jgi:hypothetical protein
MMKIISKFLAVILPAAALMFLPLSSRAQFVTGDNLNPETFYYNGTNLCNVVETGSPYYMAYCLGLPGAVQKLGNYNDNIISDGACSVAEPGSAYFYHNCLDDVLGVHGGFLVPSETHNITGSNFDTLTKVNVGGYGTGGLSYSPPATYTAPTTGYTAPVTTTPTAPVTGSNYNSGSGYGSYGSVSNFDFSGNFIGGIHPENMGAFYDNVGFLANNGGLANFGLDFPRTGLSGINNFNPGFVYSGVDFNAPGSLLPNFGFPVNNFNPFLGLY